MVLFADLVVKGREEVWVCNKERNYLKWWFVVYRFSYNCYAFINCACTCRHEKWCATNHHLKGLRTFTFSVEEKVALLLACILLKHGKELLPLSRWPARGRLNNFECDMIELSTHIHHLETKASRTNQSSVNGGLLITIHMYACSERYWCMWLYDSKVFKIVFSHNKPIK